MPGTELELDGLSVRYGSIEAVRGVSLSVREGEVVSLIGANGAGKSSTLSAVAGLVPLAGGSITFAGETLGGRSPEQVVRRGLALSPEGRRVFASLTVEENLRLGATPIPREEYPERLAYVRELFPRLAERGDQPAGTLSGGEQQMLAIGRALMSKPRMLLLDEPSMGLAPIVVKQVFSLIERLREQGLTMLLVEQDVAGALSVANRAYVMVHGAIVREGNAGEVRDSQDLRDLYLGPEAE